MTGSRIRRSGIAAMLIAGVLALGASASALGAEGDPYLKECLTRAAVAGCTASNTSSPVALAESPDGRQIYAATWTTGFFGLQIYDRNPDTGVVTRRSGTSGCFAATGSGAPCTTVGSGTLDRGYDIAITPDGRNVYLVSWGTMSLLNFSRNETSGSLTFLGCGGPAAGCTAIAGAPGSPAAMAVSPDSASLYVKTTDGLVIFDRLPTLALKQKAGADGCFTETMVAGCTKAVGLAGTTVFGDIQVSSDGTLLYTAFASPGGVSFFNRFPNGTLTQITGAAGGCISSNGNSAGVAAQCVDGNDGLAQAFTAVTSPDGRFVYVGTATGIIGYSRNLLNGVLSPIGCIGTSAGCTVARGGTDGVYSIGITPDGSEVVASSFNSSSLTFYRRDTTTGVLTQRAGTRGCFQIAGGATCQSLPGLGSGGQVAIDRGGLFVYAAGWNNGLLATIVRDFAPVCQSSNVDVAFNTALSVPLTCSDVNGDALALEKVGAPAAGLLGEINGASVFYSPFNGYTGGDSFTFRATTPARPGVASNTATISLNVAGPPPPPGGGGTVIVAGGIDADKDGFFAGQDCNDTNAAIRPGAIEIKGNNLDENCDGLAEPFPTLTSGVASKWDVKGSNLTLTALQVTQVFPKGWKAKVLCKGSKCPFKSKDLKAGKVSKGASTIITSLTKKQRKFRAGQTLEVWVSAPSFNTKVARLALKKGKIPTTVPFCVKSGETKVQKTCS